MKLCLVVAGKMGLFFIAWSPQKTLDTDKLICYIQIMDSNYAKNLLRPAPVVSFDLHRGSGGFCIGG